MINKKGQLTVFIILAIFIVIAIVLLFTLYQGPIKSYIQKQSLSPDQELGQCIGDQLEKTTDLIIQHGGYTTTQSLSKAFAYQDQIPYDNYTYLCYTPDFRARCIPKEPVLISHLNSEISNYMKDKISNCFSSVKSDLESNGYVVSLSSDSNYSVTLLPGYAEIDLQRKLVISKNDQQKEFNNYLIKTQTPLYEMFLVIQEVIRQEILYCNSDYLTLMEEHHQIDISKFQTGDDNKIYTIKNLPTGKIVRFAVRNCVIPTPN